MVEDDLESMEKLFKSRELFSQCRVEAKYIIVRCDGRNFRKLAKELRLERLDYRFHDCLVEAAFDFIINSGFDIRIAHVASDEISFLFNQVPYAGRIEKIDSITASLLSSIFTIKLVKFFNFQRSLAFDARIISLRNVEEVVNYFYWRQKVTYRNFLNTWAREALLRQGKSSKQITRLLYRVSGGQLARIIEENIKPINAFPMWQKFGTFLMTKYIKKASLDKTKNKPVVVIRRKIERANFYNKEILRKIVAESLRR